MSYPQYVGPEFITQPLQPLAAGKSGQPEVVSGEGGVAALGAIVFTTNPAADDTITLGGTTWTFKASGASGTQIDVGIDLSATLTAVVSALNGSADADTAKATYGKGFNNTGLEVFYDTPGVVGNSFVLAADLAADDVEVTPMDGGTDASIDLETEHTQIYATAETNETFQLQDGDETQRHTITMLGKADTGNVLVRYNMDGGNGSVLTFDAVGEYAVLQYLGGNWRVISAASGVAA